MRAAKISILMLALCLLTALSVQAETVYFSGQLSGLNERTEGNSVALVFRVYNQQFGGQRLLEETQTVQVAENGWFRLMLGSATSGGVAATAINGNSLWVEYSRNGNGIIGVLWPAGNCLVLNEFSYGITLGQAGNTT